MLQIISRGSNGAKALVAELNQRGVVTRRYRPKSPKLNDSPTINWGYPGVRGLNSKGLSKLTQLELIQKAGLSCIPFHRSFDKFWNEVYASKNNLEPKALDGPLSPAVSPSRFSIPTAKEDVKYPWIFSRELQHTQGRDIIRWSPWSEQHLVLVPYRFYTLGVPKQAEYRIHVFLDKAIRSGQKVAKLNANHDPNGIWNLENGWEIRYEYHNEVPKQARTLAKAGVVACGLDFGAVDILLGQDNNLYILEINKAPGLHGNTLKKWADHIERWYKEQEVQREDS